MAPNDANSYLFPVSFWSRSGCWPFLGFFLSYLVLQACISFCSVSDGSGATVFSCFCLAHIKCRCSCIFGSHQILRKLGKAVAISGVSLRKSGKNRDFLSRALLEKEAISLEIFTLAWKLQSRLMVQSWPSEFPTRKKVVWWAARLKLSFLLLIFNYQPGGRSWEFLRSLSLSEGPKIEKVHSRDTRFKNSRFQCWNENFDREWLFQSDPSLTARPGI